MQFMNVLLGLYLGSKISAKNMCELCHYAAKAGIAGDVARYGFKPNVANTGNYQRHLDRVLGFDQAERFYQMEVPGHPRDEAFGRHTM
eukprot:10441333-Alexandrium_andersonii.AAC.1